MLGLLPVGPSRPEQQIDTPQIVATGVVPPVQEKPGDPTFAPWYKRPSVIIGSVVGIAALAGLAYWAFKAK